MERVNGDEALQEKLKAAWESYDGDKTDQKAFFNNVIVPIAKEQGFELPNAENGAEGPDDEIDEEELAKASGGIGGDEDDKGKIRRIRVGTDENGNPIYVEIFVW
ncbi:MAG: hypothetical protein K6G83_08040 [Lachnospiraceae bacterium]|nr:hypothetical protein [Lachnospiraceae bacterium]